MRIVFALSFLLAACSCGSSTHVDQAPERVAEAAYTTPAERAASGEAGDPEGQASVVLAGGCFWCMESDFEPIEGVSSVVSGYAGGTSDSPTYREVSSHESDHLEVVRVFYDPSVVTFAELIERFWKSVDPTQDDGQFCDRGDQYRTAIFVDGDEERALAEASKVRIAEQLGETIDTRVLTRTRFWDAEVYHQDYYRKNPGHYQRYRRGCGRDARTAELWGSSAH